MRTREFRRSVRTRTRVRGTSDRPRLHVKITNRHVSAQIIDDEKGITLVAYSTVGKKNIKGNLTEKSEFVGLEIAKRAKAKKISRLVLDRGSKLYHGRIKAFADKARESGMEL